MFQYTLQLYMHNTLSHRVLSALCVLAGLITGGCTTDSSQPAVPEVAAIGPGGDNAQYAISTRNDRMGRIVIPVSINGQPDFRLMLDTGATHSVLTPAAAARLGIDVAQAKTSEVQGVLGRMTAPVVTVAQLQSGSLHLHDLRVPVIDGSVVTELDGILGADGMGDKTITADFMHDRIRISEASEFPVNGLYSVIKFSLVSQRLIVVDGTVGRVRVSAVIDTGGTQTLGNMALLQALSKNRNSNKEFEAGVIDITNNLQNGRLLLVPSVRLGAADITNAAVLFSDFGVFKVWHLDKRPALLIGMDVLGQLGELSINYRRQELQVRSN